MTLATRAIDPAHVRTTRAIHEDGRKLSVELSFGVIANGAGATLGSVDVGHDGGAHPADGALRSRLAELEGSLGVSSHRSHAQELQRRPHAPERWTAKSRKCSTSAKRTSGSLS